MYIVRGHSAGCEFTAGAKLVLLQAEAPAATVDQARARAELGWTARRSTLDRIVRDALT